MWEYVLGCIKNQSEKLEQQLLWKQVSFAELFSSLPIGLSSFQLWLGVIYLWVWKLDSQKVRQKMNLCTRNVVLEKDVINTVPSPKNNQINFGTN